MKTPFQQPSVLPAWERYRSRCLDNAAKRDDAFNALDLRDPNHGAKYRAVMDVWRSDHEASWALYSLEWAATREVKP